MKRSLFLKNRRFPEPVIGLGAGSRLPSRQSGVALVITLLFVVLLTGVLIAFFSRAMTNRQVANSSANTTEVALFADGAADMILGDFKQEIVDGSSQPVTGLSYYLPNTRADMLPTRAGSDDSLPNLVKRSARGVKFSPNGISRAATASSLLVSANGRKMTPARWNRSLLTARDPSNTSATDFTPIGASSANNTWTYAPDWVLVARDGSNPTTWAASAADANASNNNFVVGRYAYMIYDEGGLLDANAVGYPSGTPTTAQLANTAAYRPNMAFADLRQLPGFSSLSSATLQNNAVDLLTKIRNYTSWDSNAATAAENYFRFVLTSPKGFLTVGNTALKDNRSDVLFSSRQDLLQFLLQAMPNVGAFGAGDQTELRQKLPDALPYLTHFSRSLEQPSFAPDANRRKVASDNGGNGASGNDDLINPQFLKVRVATAFTRNDGFTPAVVGEPLVKTRFALNRLAWLTFKGPIATDAGVLSTDPDLQNIIAELKRRGLTEDFLKRGGPSNIQKYFGLSWVAYTDPESGTQTHLWRYNVHNGSGTGTGTIMRLADIAVKNREPDFIELLKSAINVGSIGKGAYTEGNATSRADFPPNFQYNQDTSTDFAVLQIAANIIDQFDLDGFPTHIRFNTGSSYPEQEFVGVENVPYFYRARVSGAEAREADPLQFFYENKQINDTGAYVAFETPEIWNPHDQNSPRCALDSSGNPLTTGGGLPLFPTGFRVVANSIDPTHFGAEKDVWIEAADPASMRSWNADTSGTPPKTPPSAPFNGDFHNKPITLTAATSALEFDVPNTTQGQGLFREPTLLMQSNVPAGSNLRPGAGNYFLNPGAGAVAGRLTGLVDGSGTVLNAPNGERYLGMFLSTVPVQWSYNNGTTNQVQVLDYFVGGAGVTHYATFRVQARDPNNTAAWATYDQKYANAIFDEKANQNTSSKRFSVSGADVTDHFAVVGDDRSANAWDPRTARFASPELNGVLAKQFQSSITYCEFALTGSDNPRYGALSTTSNVLVSNRPDYSSGFGGGESNVLSPLFVQGLPNVGGWSPSQTASPSAQNGNANVRLWNLGMVSQNSTTFSGNGKRWSGDSQTGTTGPQYYGDPDGVVRRAMGAYATGTANDTTGLPMTTATSFGGTAGSATAQAASRPMVLNRPFLSVAELGYVFSGTPWKNLSFFTAESGDTGLLDIFCVSEPTPDGLAAGKVNLNTRQVPVLQAILAGAYKDDHSVVSGTLVTPGTSGEATQLANLLVARTSGVTTNGQAAPSGGAQPLRNIGELVGSMTASGSPPTYDGFSADVATAFSNATDQKIQRRREAPIRALAACGQTRVWNLMIDVVAQTGRYPTGATGPDRFIVKGEQRKWVHVAVDRFTGAIIDKQVEVVHE